MKVLIADDDQSSRLLLKTILSAKGYEVIPVCDGDQAWEILKMPESPKLLILDWVMPGMDGLDLCRKIRAEFTDDSNYIYIILLTANDSSEDIVRGMNAGADDYIVKPCDREEFYVRMRAGQRIVELHTELVEARKALEYQAMHDPLTGIMNRRAIYRIIDSEMSRLKRNVRNSLGVAMMDVDFFKKINDNYGHKAGDEVLCKIVQRIRPILRPYDNIGRYGGEEFLIVIPGVKDLSDRSVFERMRKAISDKEIQTSAGSIKVTASFGVAFSTEGCNIESLIQSADKSLYRAKKSGRNRVTYANDVEAD